MEGIETGFPEGDPSFRVRSIRLNINNYFFRFPRKGLIVLELELVLVLGAISQVASAATRGHQRQILTTPTPTIEFEDEDEFEDDFLDLVAWGEDVRGSVSQLRNPAHPGPPGRGSFPGAEVPAYFQSASPRREHRWRGSRLDFLKAILLSA